MNFFVIFGIAVALSMDAFSVSIASSLRIKKITFGHSLRMALFFGAFQFFMPLIGYWAGIYIEKIVNNYDHWLAFALLAVVGIKMIIESFKKKDDAPAKDPTKGLTIIILSVATSIDAVAVGFSFAVLKAGILYPSAVIGVVCFALTYIGTKIGKKAEELGSVWVERFGGAVLILIGIKILIDHIA